MTARGDRTLALAAGLVLGLVFTAWAAFGIAGWTIGTVTHVSHRELRGPVRELSLVVGSGDVTVSPGDGDRVTIDSRVRGSLHAPSPDVQVRGDMVSVQGGCSGFVFGHCGASIDVRVPRGTALRLSTSSGDARVSGLSAPVSVRASSGDVELIELTGGTDARLASGDLTVRGLSGHVALESASGDVVAEDLRSAMLVAQAASGDVFASLATVPDDVDLTSASGDVSLRVPHANERPYRVDAETDSGDREVAVATDPQATHVLRVHANSGDVSVGYTER